MVSTRSLASLALAMLTLGAPGAALASDEPSEETALTWKGKLGFSSSLNLGNISQIRLLSRGHLTHAIGAFENDLDMNLMFMWWRLQPGDPFMPFGREVTGTQIARWHLTDRLQITQLARYESSQIRAIDHRVSAGAGLGWHVLQAPEASSLVMLAALGEGTLFASSDFALDPSATEPTRFGPRVAAYARFQARSDDASRTLRTYALFIANPMYLQEFRTTIDATVTFRVFGPLGLTLSGTWIYDSYHVNGVSPSDLRMSAGLSLSGGSEPSE